jgi:drug/metabolite transporter (DMT)-like permease
VTANLGELAALATAICWTMTALSFESAGRRVGSLAVNIIRLALALVFLTAFGAIARGHALPVDAGGRAWLWLGVSGLIGFCLGDLCLFRAFVLIGARLAMLFMSLVPPMVALISLVALGEKLSGHDLLGMALTVGGVTWVVGERRRRNPGPAGAATAIPAGTATTAPAGAGSPGLPGGPQAGAAGVLLGLGAAAGQAVGLVLSKYAMGSYHPFAATQIRVIAGVAGFAVLFSLFGWWPRVWAALRHRPAMARITLGAVFGPFLGVSFSLLAVQKTQAGVASAIMSIVPVLIIGPSILLFKERVSPRAVAGAAVAVAGVAVLFLT